MKSHRNPLRQLAKVYLAAAFGFVIAIALSQEPSLYRAMKIVPHKVSSQMEQLALAVLPPQPAEVTIDIAPSQPAPAIVESAPNVAVAAVEHRPVAAPGPTELSRIAAHVKDSLTREMVANFDLFLFVSKAASGPASQRMYVLRKKPNGDLAMLYNWPVSTGREKMEIAPNGTRAPSFTPAGFYELDPSRMYVHHVSGQWRQPMPYAMFFNWENHGYQTGLAIHGAAPGDIQFLGSRSSAGCVHLAPENAALLFNLIRKHYKGDVPRFAYDAHTATMANDGALMHDSHGNLQMAQGYRVLVFIENYDGQNVVAALF